MHVLSIGLFLIFAFSVTISTLLIRRAPLVSQKPIFIAVCILLMTPSWIPAALAGALVPLGFLLLASLFGGFAHEVPSLVYVLWQWHIVSFSLTGLLAYFISNKVFTNKAIKSARRAAPGAQ